MIHNPYRGINAHLNSLLQNGEGWAEFHNNYIADMTRALKAQLLNTGYIATAEKGLQIRRAVDDLYIPKADITIYDADALRASIPTVKLEDMAGEVVLELPRLLSIQEDSDTYYLAIAIYPRPKDKRGAPIVWMELLSPSNKVGRDLEFYQSKRMELLRTGIVFIEIDFLHQTPPTFATFPDYTKGEAQAYPYHITLIDPRPHLLEGTSRTRFFSLDDPIPTMTIPLSSDERIDFDFNAPYSKTFEEMLYGNDLDYTQVPARLHAYSEKDQQTIRQVMEGISHDS